MRRARHPVPAPIKCLHYNPLNRKYEIAELDILYQLELEHTRLLKEYFRGYGYNTSRSVFTWYDKLDQQTKKQISRTGNVQSAVDFYPD